MGVTGLWRLIEPAGKPVPVETLENKVLAVDISIWLHQVVKGYQDAKGAPLPNAHLMGLFQRLCKLLYFRIKPVFVFDGAFPELKKETIARRNSSKAKYNTEAEHLRREILSLLGKRTAIGALIGKTVSPTKIPKQNSLQANTEDDLFKLPALPQKEAESDSESEEEESSSSSTIDLHTVDVETEEFKTMPLKEKYDLLIELKETRKMNSWGRLHELPKKSDNFSDFQMKRLLKRRKVQEVLEETEKEMGGNSLSLNELESLLNEEGISTEIERLPTKRIASSDSTRFLLIKNVKKTLEEARKEKDKKDNELKVKQIESVPSTSKVETSTFTTTVEDTCFENNLAKKDELDEDLEKAIQMSLECLDEPNPNICNNSKAEESIDSSFTLGSNYSGSDEDSSDHPDLTAAKAYIMQYSDFTHKAVDTIVSTKTNCKDKTKSSKIDEILKELQKDKTLIADYVDISSDANEYVESERENKTDRVNSCSEKDVMVLEMSQEHDSLEMKCDSDNTQSSVVYVVSPKQNIINLDTSTDMEAKQVPTVNYNENNSPESEDSDGEFEDVPENRTENETKTVVELTLNMEQTLDDDIFADVFSNKTENDLITTDFKESNIPKDFKINGGHKITSDRTQNMDVEIKSLLNQEVVLVTEKKSFECHQDTVTPSKGIRVNEPKKYYQKNNITISDTPQNHIDSTIEKEDLHDSREFLNKIVTDAIKDTQTIDTPASHTDKISKEKMLGLDVAQTDTVKSDVIPEKPNTRPTQIDDTLKEKLQDLADAMQIEEEDFIQEKGKLDRMGRNINEQMTKEVQELLQIFGIPYVVAPTEAEAQCAFLESIKLTDGTITDDSDIWLFGGRTVYKNFFNQQKHVKQFLADRIEKSFNLTREQLILLALLVGSDYTVGVSGVGPVTAMEILASFPYSKKELQAKTSEQARYVCLLSGLLEFKKWVKAGKRTDNTNLKKKLRNVDVADDFPSIKVVHAYLEPYVEKSKETFTWGEPDLTVLCDYTKTKFGWSQNKFEEIMKPVVKRMLERKSQKTLYNYFNKKIEFQSLEEHMSKRVRAAVQKMGPEEKQLNEDSEIVQPGFSSNKKRKKSTKKKISCKSNISDVSDIQDQPKDKRRRTKNVAKPVSVEIKAINDAVGTSNIEIVIPKLNRHQEIIPQREKDMENILQNKMKAIEIFRKTKIDRKSKRKRKVILPKEKAELSESSDSN